MKKCVAFSILLTIVPLFSFSQLKGKVLTISNDSLCKSTVHFTTDSVAYYITRCGDDQMCTKMNYIINDYGSVVFSKVPDSLYKPFIGLTRIDLNNIHDSLAAPRLVFMDKGTVVTNFSWTLWGKNTGGKTGTDLRLIPAGFFTDTSAIIEFYDLYGITRTFLTFHSSDFEGEGSVYCVNLDLPPLFGDCSTIYSSDFFDLSRLHYRVIKGKLHFWNTPEWIPVE